MTLSIFKGFSAGFLLGIEHSPHDYSAVAAKLGLVSLAERRRMLCVVSKGTVVWSS